MQRTHRRAGGGFWYGVAEALLLPLAFVGLGLAWYGPMARADGAAQSYAPRVAPARETWLVDGFNVVQVAMLGGRDRETWWQAPRRAELLDRAAAFEGDATVLVVFDGGREAPEPADRRVRAVFAPSADTWLVARVRRAAEGDRVVVVTADRRLAGRVRRHGARVVSPGAFLARCGEPARPAPEWGDSTSL